MKPGFYWVRFNWGWEPALLEESVWFRCGAADPELIEHVEEVGPELVKPDGYPRNDP